MRATPSIPVYRGKPVVGVFPQLLASPFTTLVKASKLGEVVQLELPGPRVFLVTDPAKVDHVIANHTVYTKDTRDYDQLRKVTRTGLVGSKGPHWLRQRRLMQPAFHRQSIQRFAEAMTSAANEMVDGWAGYLRTGEPFDLAKEVSRATLDIVGRTLISGDLTTRFEEVYAAIAEVLDQVAIRATDPFLPPDWVPIPFHRKFARALGVIDSIVEGVIDERRRSGARPGDLLDMLLDARDAETREVMSDEEVRDEAVGMFIGGHETSSQAVTFAFYFLSQHPDVERTVRDELARVLGGRLPTADDVPHLRWTTAVIRESMRMYPPGWAVSRAVVQDDDCVGLALRKGDTVTVSPYLMHHKPSLWSNPEGFDPSRFLDSPDGARNGEKRPKSAYMPFSFGARKCIGDTFAMMEMPLILATVLQRARVELDWGYRLELESGLTLHPKGGLPVIARPA